MPSDVIVQLFQWRYADIAIECCSFLGPGHVKAVQVSPVVEQRNGTAWSASYQPVSYRLKNRLGDEAAFAAMCAQCASCGVDVLVDVVANHMAEGGGVSSEGTTFGSRTYGSLYQPSHFHHDVDNLLRNCGVANYSDQDNVQRCDLLGLPDLDVSQQYVRETIGALLRKLAALGARGVRMDAAKHMNVSDVAALLAHGPSRWVYDDILQEVIEGPNEPAALHPAAYVGNGRVTEFSYGWIVAEKLSANQLTHLHGLRGPPDGIYSRLPSSQALVFIDNHDTQRMNDARLTHENGTLYAVANAFMLAWPYGRPRLMSSYPLAYDDDQPSAGGTGGGSGGGGVPASPVHDVATAAVHCGPGEPWVCEHRWPLVAQMVRWRAAAGGGSAAVEHWQQGNDGQIAFARNSSAFVAFSLPIGSVWSTTLQTGLPAGAYCDVAADERCGRVVEVASDGTVMLAVGATAGVPLVAIHVDAMAPSPPSLPPPPSPSASPPASPLPLVPSQSPPSEPPPPLLPPPSAPDARLDASAIAGIAAGSAGTVVLVAAGVVLAVTLVSRRAKVQRRQVYVASSAS